MSSALVILLVVAALVLAAFVFMVVRVEREGRTLSNPDGQDRRLPRGERPGRSERKPGGSRRS